MQEATPSRTAFGVARRRALHQLYDRPPIFADPFAVRILGLETALDLETRAERPEPLFSIVFRAFMAARSRYAEDQLAHAVAAGVRQYVLLGAGLDTFAYRNPHPGLRVFEVDHPATQAWKHERLAEARIPIPADLAFVAVDFEKQSLGEELSRAGLLAGEPVFFAWLGVVPYLTLEAFRATVRFIAERPLGSGFACDYPQPREALPPREQAGHDLLAARVQRAGEPFQLFFTPQTMRAELSAFSRIEDIGAEEINLRYFVDRADGQRMWGSGARLLSAWR